MTIFPSRKRIYGRSSPPQSRSSSTASLIRYMEAALVSRKAILVSFSKDLTLVRRTSILPFPSKTIMPIFRNSHGLGAVLTLPITTTAQPKPTPSAMTCLRWISTTQTRSLYFLPAQQKTVLIHSRNPSGMPSCYRLVRNILRSSKLMTH